MNELLKLLSRRMNVIIAITIACFAICIAVTIFYRPADKTGSAQINEALENQRKAVIEHRESVEKLVAQTQATVTYFKAQDSALSEQLNKTLSEIKNVRNEAKIRIIDTYDSEQLQHAFAELERQYINP